MVELFDADTDLEAKTTSFNVVAFDIPTDTFAQVWALLAPYFRPVMQPQRVIATAGPRLHLVCDNSEVLT